MAPPPKPKESFWTITAVDATANSVSATEDSGSTKTFRVTPATSVTINGTAEKLASLKVGMKGKIELFGSDMLTKIDIKSGSGSGAASGSGKKKK